MRKLISSLLGFLLISSLLLCACAPTVPNITTAAPQTTAAPEIIAALETTAAPETTVAPETTATLEETILPTESSSAADLSFGNLPAETDELLSFSGLPWGTSLDEALDILELEESHYEVLDQLTRQTILLNNAKWFGVTSSRAMIAFDDDMLTTIYICYPDDADMQVVKANLESIYGSPSNAYTYYRRRLPQEIDRIKEIVVPMEYATDEQTVFWVSDVHYSDYLGEDKTTDWVNHMRAHNTGCTAEAFEEIAKLNPFSSIMWSTNGTEDALNLNCPNVVVLACDLLRLSAAD